MDRSPELLKLLRRGPVAVNLGIRDFAKALRDQGAEVVEVDWTPPAEDEAELAAILDKVL